MKVVAVMTRVPPAAPGGVPANPPPAIEGPKTRLAAVLPDVADRERLQRAMLADVLAAARAARGAIVRVAITPGGSPEALADLGVGAGQVITQQGDSLGARQRAVFTDLFRRGATQVLIVGSDVPLLTATVLDEAFAALAADPEQVVLGPASDGGYYLLGISGPKVPDLFTGVRWSTLYTLVDTLRRCEFEQRRVAFLPILDDVDEPADLARLRDTLVVSPTLAPHSAAALGMSQR